MKHLSSAVLEPEFNDDRQTRGTGFMAVGGGKAVNARVQGQPCASASVFCLKFQA